MERVLCNRILFMSRNSLIDFIRALLIFLVILVHIVHFGDLHPNVKSMILAFMMPTFLVITGFLVNVEKSIAEFCIYLTRIILPYVIMVCGYMVVSIYLPVRDGVKVLDFTTFYNVLFITSIGPYWFFKVMILCGICYYVVFNFRRKGPLMANEVYVRYIILAIFLLLLSQYTPFLSAKSAIYYFIGVGVRLFVGNFRKICIGTFWAVIPFIIILTNTEWRDWGEIYVLFCVICFLSITTKVYQLCSNKKICNMLLYIGRNTLPIYIFHPIFTMLSKYTVMYFGFDNTGILHALFTIILCVIGSILIAKVMDISHCSYIFARRTILR